MLTNDTGQLCGELNLNAEYYVMADSEELSEAKCWKTAEDWHWINCTTSTNFLTLNIDDSITQDDQAAQTN